jgi:hypothetical protein
MHIKFSIGATQSVSGSFMHRAVLASEVAIPAMRLTYTP